jgi:hypothetical protein
MLQAVRSQVRVLVRSSNFYNLSNPSSRTTALGFIQPATEMSTRLSIWGKARPACKADDLIANCEQIV